MRRIQKNKTPVWFENWKKNYEKSTGRKAVYKTDLPERERRQLRKELLEEQGYICCYCMKRIDLNHSHLEHFWPKSIFPDKDMNYENMLVSCEGEVTGGDHCGHKKENWYDKDMIIPTDIRIESMFNYTLDGKIIPAHQDNRSVIESKMIHEWGLDSFHLERNRRMALEQSEIYDGYDYEEDEIWDIINYYDGKQNGKYIEYCNAIINVLKRVLLNG